MEANRIGIVELNLSHGDLEISYVIVRQQTNVRYVVADHILTIRQSPDTISKILEIAKEIVSSTLNNEC